MEASNKLLAFLVLSLFFVQGSKGSNPVFPGWYADPEGAIYGDKYWIFPTTSLPATEQLFFDAYSSTDLVTWTKHSRILDNSEITWGHRDFWAPATFFHDGKYYFVFGANAINSNQELGGIGIAWADKPEGPYKDLIGRPLIDEIVNGAQPIDQYVFLDSDGTHYMYYGGWSHCNVVKLGSNFTYIEPFDDGTYYKEVTPSSYVEGPFMFKRNGTYYFMWSEGGWTGPDYKVAYAMSDSPLGPFERIGIILEQDSEIATGAGHHSVIQVPGKDQYYIVYHRRPLGETDQNHRVTCVDEMKFDDQGFILPVKMTFEGVTGPPL